MKRLIANYTFDKTAKTVTFSDYGSITLENVLLITNVASNVIIYQFSQTGKGGDVAGNVLTLDFDTSSMSNGDHLQIFYDDPSYTPSLAGGASTSANQTNGTQQTRITDGTNVASVLKSDGTAAGQNAQMVAGSGMTTATITLNSGTPNTTWFDLLNYPWISIEILTNTTPASITFQTSGDASQTNTATANLMSASGSVLSTTTSVNGSFYGPRTGRYFRVSTNNGAGTTTLVLTFYTTAGAAMGANVTQSGTWTVGSNSATGSATPANAFLAGMADSANLVGLRAASAVGDGSSAGTSVLAASGYIFNGSTFDKPRGATSAAGTTGTGVQAAGMLGYDGSTNYYRAKVDSGGNQYVAAYGMTDALYSGATALTPKFASITANTSGATTLVAAVASKRIRVLSYTLLANAAVNVKFQSHVTPTDITGLLYLAANTGASVGYSPVGLFQTVAGEALDINLSGAIAVGGHLVYVEA